MKKRHLILPSGFLILLMILVGTAILLPVGAETIIGSAHFDPDRIDLNLPAEAIYKAEIRFPSGAQRATVKDIDNSTILLEGSLPTLTTYLIPGALVAEFDGEVFVNIVWNRIFHDTLTPPYKIWLTITGNLYESAGGTPFSAQGDIKIIVPHTPPPP